MTLQISGAPAEDGDRSKARAERILLVGELDRIRVRALAWRNGLGALLAGLIGFSLIKGRSDVTELRPSFAVWVGVLLLLALLVGGVAAVLIIRAAHGRPFARSLRKLGGGGDPIDAARWAEIHGSERALWYGVLLSFSCVVLLVGAVGLTWYGPPKDKPRLEIRLIGGTRYCGEVVAVAGGRLTLKTTLGQVAVDLTQADGMAPVDSCSPPRP